MSAIYLEFNKENIERNIRSLEREDKWLSSDDGKEKDVEGLRLAYVRRLKTFFEEKLSMLERGDNVRASIREFNEGDEVVEFKMSQYGRRCTVHKKITHFKGTESVVHEYQLAYLGEDEPIATEEGFLGTEEEKEQLSEILRQDMNKDGFCPDLFSEHQIDLYSELA